MASVLSRTYWFAVWLVFAIELLIFYPFILKNYPFHETSIALNVMLAISFLFLFYIISEIVCFQILYIYVRAISDYKLKFESPLKILYGIITFFFAYLIYLFSLFSPFTHRYFLVLPAGYFFMVAMRNLMNTSIFLVKDQWLVMNGGHLLHVVAYQAEGNKLIFILQNRERIEWTGQNREEVWEKIQKSGLPQT